MSTDVEKKSNRVSTAQVGMKGKTICFEPCSIQSSNPNKKLAVEISGHADDSYPHENQILVSLGLGQEIL